MVLLEVDQFFFKSLKLHLQIRLGESQLIQERAQAIDISLHVLTESIFGLKPNPQKRKGRIITDSLNEMLFLLYYPDSCFIYNQIIFCVCIIKSVDSQELFSMFKLIQVDLPVAR